MYSGNAPDVLSNLAGIISSFYGGFDSSAIAGEAFDSIDSASHSTITKMFGDNAFSNMLGDGINWLDDMWGVTDANIKKNQFALNAQNQAFNQYTQKANLGMTADSLYNGVGIRVNDLQNNGLSPVLAAGSAANSGATASSVPNSQASLGGNAGNSLSNFAGLIGAMTQANLAGSQKKVNDSMVSRNNADTDYLIENAKKVKTLLGPEYQKLQEEIKETAAKTTLYHMQTQQGKAAIEKIQNEIAAIGLDNKLREFQVKSKGSFLSNYSLLPDDFYQYHSALAAKDNAWTNRQNWKLGLKNAQIASERNKYYGRDVNWSNANDSIGLLLNLANGGSKSRGNYISTLLKMLGKRKNPDNIDSSYWR